MPNEFQYPETRKSSSQKNHSQSNVTGGGFYKFVFYLNFKHTQNTLHQ